MQFRKTDTFLSLEIGIDISLIARLGGKSTSPLLVTAVHLFILYPGKVLQLLSQRQIHKIIQQYGLFCCTVWTVLLY